MTFHSGGGATPLPTGLPLGLPTGLHLGLPTEPTEPGAAPGAAAPAPAPGLTRRRLLVGGSAAAVAAGAARAAAVVASGVAAVGGGCATRKEPPRASGTSSSGWEFRDDRGITVSRRSRPRRIVAYISSAAGLWDFGVRPIAVFGPQLTATGASEIEAGNVDLQSVDSVGKTWDDFDLQKLRALRADLVVTGQIGPDPWDLWAIPKGLGPQIERIAPIAAISEYKVVLPRVIERYSQLAQALGARMRTPKLAAARDEFERASDELRRVAREKAGMVVLVVSAATDVVYVAKPEYFGDLAYYTELGLDIVRGGGTADYWEKLSWNDIGKYPADLILTDTRSFAMPRHQMDSYPQWRQLPAVQAGQVGDWSAEPWFNYTLAAPIIRSVAALVQAARADLVG